MSPTVAQTPGKKTILIRIHEWTAWLPQHPDASVPRLLMSAGLTGFVMGDDEKMLECAVSSTGQQRSIPMDDPEHPGDEKRRINVKHGLYVFQAVLASAVEGEQPIPTAVPPGSEGHAVVLPGSTNRKERREGGKRNGHKS